MYTLEEGLFVPRVSDHSQKEHNMWSPSPRVYLSCQVVLMVHLTAMNDFMEATTRTKIKANCSFFHFLLSKAIDFGGEKRKGGILETCRLSLIS